MSQRNKIRVRASLLSKALIWYCAELVETCPVHRGEASLERARRDLVLLQQRQHRLNGQTPEWEVPVVPVPPPDGVIGGYDVAPEPGFETRFLVMEDR
jgi:hypothetical protein